MAMRRLSRKPQQMSAWCRWPRSARLLAVLHHTVTWISSANMQAPASGSSEGRVESGAAAGDVAPGPASSSCCTASPAVLASIPDAQSASMPRSRGCQQGGRAEAGVPLPQRARVRCCRMCGWMKGPGLRGTAVFGPAAGCGPFRPPCWHHACGRRRMCTAPICPQQ